MDEWKLSLAITKLAPAAAVGADDDNWMKANCQSQNWGERESKCRGLMESPPT
jgi:hypothetical protein